MNFSVKHFLPYDHVYGVGVHTGSFYCGHCLRSRHSSVETNMAELVPVFKRGLVQKAAKPTQKDNSCWPFGRFGLVHDMFYQKMLGQSTMANQHSGHARHDSFPEIQPIGPYSSYELQNARSEFIRSMTRNESAAIRKLKRKCQFAMFGPNSSESLTSHDNVHLREKEPVISPPSAKPSGSNNPSAIPSGGNNTSAKPSGGNNPSAKPSGGNNPSAKPSGGNNPSAKPSGSNNPSSKPSGGNNTSAKPSGGNNTSAKPSEGNNPSAKPSGGNNPSAKPSGGNNPSAKSSGGKGDAKGDKRTGTKAKNLSPDLSFGDQNLVKFKKNSTVSRSNPTEGEPNNQKKEDKGPRSTLEEFQFVSPRKTGNECLQSTSEEVLFGKPRKRGNECLQAEDYMFGKPRSSSNGTEQLCQPETGTESNLATGVDHPITEPGAGEPRGKRARLDKTNFENCWRCDLCELTDLDREVMRRHLTTELHYSASLCKRDTRKTEIEAISVVSKALLTHQPAVFQSLVPICPVNSCKSIFKDIYVCSLHYSLSHNNPNVQDLYSVAEVEMDETLPYVDAKKCKCGITFLKSKQLFSHWRKDNHHPYAPCDSGAFQVFMCNFCPKIFYTFMESNLHLSNHAEGVRKSKKFTKVQRAQKASKLTIRVLTLRKPDKPRLHLPDHCDAGTEVAVCTSMRKLRELKKFTRGGPGRKKIRREIQSLRRISKAQKAGKLNDKYHVKH